MWTPSDLVVWPRPASWSNDLWWSPGSFYTAPSWSETTDGYELAIELPGFRKRDATVEVKGQVIDVRAEREPGLWSKDHRAVHHAITLPPFADSTTVRADFRGGRLEIRVDKQQSAKARVIPIRVNGELPSTPVVAVAERRPVGRRLLDSLRAAWRDAVEFVVAAFRWPTPFG